MCGISGMICSDLNIVQTACAAMSAAESHRGPDAVGLEVFPFDSQFLGLAHRRLSILDLSPLGGQPMTDPESGNVIVYNGEIYNFAKLRRELEHQGACFRGRSDTEVLLKALSQWGVHDALRRLEGMYAFAFLDARANVLTLARDPLGIKPLYVAGTKNCGIAFASEVRALLACGQIAKTLDRRGLAGFLAYGAAQHPFTLFEGVTSLPPGTFQQFTAASGGWTKSAPESFWRFPELDHGASECEALDCVRTELELAVRDHLVADVPVGVFLSGGLDSTILAGLAARHNGNTQTFTVGFSDQPDFSETQLAAETAARLGLPHVPINLPGREAEAAVVDWLAAADQPSIDGLNTFVISRAVRKLGIKVALSGLGSDELFGGYPSFRDVPRMARVGRRMAWCPRGVRRGAVAVATARKPRAVARKLSDMMAKGGSLSDLYFHRRRTLSDREMNDLRFSPLSLGLTPHYQHPSLTGGFDEGDAVRTISELESRFYQGNMLLRDSDVMGMAHGLEIRVPFLDRRLLDTVHALPGSVRLPPRAPGKHLLRGAFTDLLRPDLLDRPKTGFTLPLSRWMLGPLRGVCQQSLRACTEIAELPGPAVRRVWDEFVREPAGPQWTRALSLVALGNYVHSHVS